MPKDPNILRVSETDIKRAVQEMLEREQPEVATRIRHLMMDVAFDEHSYVPVGVNVYLNPEGAKPVPGDAHLPPVSPEVKAELLRRVNED